MTATTAASRPVGLGELQRAWQAVQDGQFRLGRPAGPSTSGQGGDLARWCPAGPVLPVVGCVGQAGASSLAVALATVAGPARAIECCTATASGLAAASSAELGSSAGGGWTVGRRDLVQIVRTAAVHLGVDEVPTPEVGAGEAGLTVLDVGWELGHVVASRGWVAAELARAGQVVAVTTATVPGLRRLEIALSLLGHTRVVVAVLGPARRRWSRELVAALGPTGRVLDEAGRLVQVPVDRMLAARGIDARRLPPSLLAAAKNVLHQVGAGANKNREGLS
jgi:hypothetical protein